MTGLRKIVAMVSALVTLGATTVLIVLGSASAQSAAARGTRPATLGPGRHAQPLGTSNMAALASLARTAATPAAFNYHIPEMEHRSPSVAPLATLGGASAPASTVVQGGGGASGFNAINILEMENAGTGKYAGTNGGLEPPDQALCVGNGYVLEGVNQAWKVFTTRGAPLTPAVPITQFFKVPPVSAAPPSSFVSDPRCMYDAATGRFFALTLEADEASGLTTIPFLRAHTYFAVSKTGDPSGDWYIFNIDITDDGLSGTPLHPSCPCIDDQPLMGTDKYGFYISANEYSDSEIFPVSVPPKVYNLFGTLPDYRIGQAQAYALSKNDLIHGLASPVQSFDTATVPVPAQDMGKTPRSVWSSLQPASSPPGDNSPAQPFGAEFFLSQLDFQFHGDNRIAVWAMTNTSSLATAHPNVHLRHTIVTTLNPGETYTAPIYGVDQKNGPTPLGDGCNCPEERVNANDDRMNEVMLTNGTLWGGVNTSLPRSGLVGKAADKRAGIMYFQIRPSVSLLGNVSAAMVRDGYVQVAGDNVLFPSIAASPSGPVGMFFTLTGQHYLPSAAWARLDGLAPDAAPDVHISAAGFAPEDGFTGYPTTNQAGLVPLDPQNGAGTARWGDYTYAEVDEQGCMWGAAEYIPNEARDPAAGNWGTFITRIQPEGCEEPSILPPTVLRNVDPCTPLFTDPSGDDVFNADIAPVEVTRGQNPQMDIIAGDLKLSDDGKTLSTILTINDLSKKLPLGGEANDYYTYFTFAGVTYYTQVEVSPTGITYTDGTDVNGLRTARASDDKGAFIAGKNGKVIVNVPTQFIGKPHSGNLIQGANAETRELEAQAIVLQYDAAGPKNDYVAGAVCVQTVTHHPSTQPTAHKKAVSGSVLPTTGGLPEGVAALVAILAGLTTVAAVRWRRDAKPPLS